MSKISFEFDTVTKELTVTKDGVAMTDIAHIGVYKSYGEEGKYSISIESETVDKEQKTAVRTTIYACEGAPQSEFAAAVAARYGV